MRPAAPDDAARFPARLLRLAAALTILLTGIAKGGFDPGAGGLAVPLMALFIAQTTGAAIVLPILCAMDIFGVHASRRRWFPLAGACARYAMMTASSAGRVPR